MNLELPDELVDQVAEVIAERVAARVEAKAGGGGTPWMNTGEAIEYTRLPRGTFEKMAARGVFGRGHGQGRRRVYHRSELDRGLGYVPQDGTSVRRIGRDAA